MARSSSNARSRGSAPTKRAARKAARKSARKRAPRTGRKRSRKAAPRAKRPGMVSLLLFWPFHLVNYFTRKWHPVLKWPARAAGFCAVSLGLFAAMVAVIYLLRAGQYDLDKVATMPARTVVYSRDGRTELGRLHGDNRYIVQHDEVSHHFKNALISREDARFRSHFGIDVRGLARATVENIKRKRLAQGGSTLTIQLAENTYFSPESSRKKPLLKLLDQKFMEMALAVRIEQKYDKDEILQHYMNRIFWGHSIRGIEAASRTYFEKSADQLTLSEAAMLAGIIRGPNTYSPFKSMKSALAVRDVTLDRMVMYKHISESEAKSAKKHALKVRPKHRRIVQETYVMDTVRRELDLLLEKHNIKEGGLTVITTVDANIQRAAEIAIEKQLTQVEKTSGYRHQTRKSWLSIPAARRNEPAYLQSACVVIENRTGAVLAVVGGRDADESKYNRALQAERQIGSLFKPFVYLTAFNNGLLPGNYISDARLRPGEIDGVHGVWNASNSDGKFGGYMTVANALIRSRNTPSIRVGNYVGLKRVNATALDVGFVQGIPHNPSSYLGSWEATPWQVASAYTVFPNNGEWYRPFLIQEIRNADNERIWPGKGDSGKLVVSAADPGATWCVSNTLEQVIERGTARKVRSLGYKSPCAGKTGTTDNYKDAWFAGYTGTITCAVWVGMDKPTRIINRGYGSTLAAPIWVDVMKTADRLGYATPKFKPLRPQSARLCRYSGKYATSGCSQHNAAYTATLPSDVLPERNDFCTVHPLRALPPSRNPRGQDQRPPSRAIPVPSRAVPVPE